MHIVEVIKQAVSIKDNIVLFKEPIQTGQNFIIDHIVSDDLKSVKTEFVETDSPSKIAKIDIQIDDYNAHLLEGILGVLETPRQQATEADTAPVEDLATDAPETPEIASMIDVATIYSDDVLEAGLVDYLKRNRFTDRRLDEIWDNANDKVFDDKDPDSDVFQHITFEQLKELADLKHVDLKQVTEIAQVEDRYFAIVPDTFIHGYFKNVPLLEVVGRVQTKIDEKTISDDYQWHAVIHENEYRSSLRFNAHKNVVELEEPEYLSLLVAEYKQFNGNIVFGNLMVEYLSDNRANAFEHLPVGGIMCEAHHFDFRIEQQPISAIDFLNKVIESSTSKRKLVYDIGADKIELWFVDGKGYTVSDKRCWNTRMMVYAKENDRFEFVDNTLVVKDLTESEINSFIATKTI